VTGDVDDRPTFPLAHLLELAEGRVAEWEAIGAGEPLLWIEGGPGLPAHLARPDVALVADLFRGYLVKAPGCGRSTAPASADGYGLDATVRYFDEVRRALGLGRVTLMGHSWGALVALAMALAVPDAVRRLVLIDGYAGAASVADDIADAEREAAVDRLRHYPWFEHARAAFGVDIEPTARELDERFEACWPLYFAMPESDVAREHIARLRRETRWNIEAVRAWDPEPPIDLLPLLGAIRCPTLVIVGEHDFICGPAWNRPIADAIPGAVYAEIPGVGHIPEYEAPDAFRRVILDWLRVSPSVRPGPGNSGSGR